jgi:DNA primase large subunit
VLWSQVLRHSLPETKEDYRLDSVLRCLLDHYESGSYRPNLNPTDVLQVEDLNEVSRKSFPPCMRRLHEALTTKHHLRHGGRQQYQLFLKGAGLPMEECLRFWRNEFVKVMAADKVQTVKNVTAVNKFLNLFFCML